MKAYKYYLLLLSIFPIFCHATDWNNYIINYSKNLYGKGSQTWQMKSYSNRWLFFANQNGMVQFDGTSWSLYPIHNAGAVRSILPSANKRRIYVGGINEFGYFTPANNGKLSYTCLSEQLHGKEQLYGNIWNIFEYENILYFQGDSRILKLINGKPHYIDVKQKIDCSGMVNGVLYIGTTRGLFVLVGNSTIPLQGTSILQNKHIRSILPYGNKMLIVTAFDGIYCYDGHSVQPFYTSVETFLRLNEVFTASISGDKLAIGSVRNGLAVYNLKTKAAKYFSEINGMQNNTVLSTTFDFWGNLWAGLDSGGVDYLILNSPLTNLYSFPYSYGTGYTALLNGNLLYLGTNRGLFSTSYPVKLNGILPAISAVQNGKGQVWELTRIGNDIFCSLDRGIFLLQGKSIKRITNIMGVWSCKSTIEDSNKVLVGVYDGMYLIEKHNGNWKEYCRIDGITMSCRSFAEESKQILWVANGSKAFRYILSKNLKRVVRSRSFDLKKLFDINKNAKVVKIGNSILISTSKGVLQYNPKTFKLEPWKMTKDLQGQNVSYLTQYNNTLIGLTPEHIDFFDIKTGKEKNTCIEIPSLPLVQEAEVIVPLSESSMIIPNDNGFALLNMPQATQKIDYSHMLNIRNVYLTYPKDSLIYTSNFMDLKNKPEIGFSLNSIRFEYGIATFANIEGITYQYRLNNKEWSDFTTSKIKEYSNLHEGKYTFEVKAIFPNGSVSTDSFSFIVLPPWYRTGWAYTFYFLLFVIALWYLYRWDDMRVARKKRQAVIEKDKEMVKMEKEYKEEKAEKERQIVELEKEKLEYDLKHKSQEMANLMINFVRKNEILTEIRSDLFKVLASLKGENNKDSKQMLILVRNKIDSNIQGDEVLKKIEDQFDLVHNNFMKNLRDKHPELSNNERMMCAYLKMGLSSKEIAPLLNISVRGVETIRYRLRKKFELDRDSNLTEYLSSL